MASDVNKNLERARRSLEKNKLREALAMYQAILQEFPGHQESVQALADIHTRLNEPALAAQYYGAQFDRLLEAGDTAKASAIFARFLRSVPQPPDRLMRYGHLLQKNNRVPEAIEQFSAAAELFLEHQRDIEAVACYESLALLDPEKPERHVALAELAERLQHADLAGRSYLRAGQLTQAAGKLDDALDYFDRAHRLLPMDRTCALLLAEAKLRTGDAQSAAALLEPLVPGENDTTFLALYGESLLRTSRLDRAREVFEAYYRQKPESAAKIFELIAAYLRAGEDAKGAALLRQAKDWMRKSRKESELGPQMDRLGTTFPNSLPLAEAIAAIYEELNREAKYFDALIRVFDLYLAADRLKDACEVLDRLVDIDPYDYRNQERIAKIEGKADPAFLRAILSRAAKAATVSTHTDRFAEADLEAAPATPSSGDSGAQNLDDLLVQVEIFLQYSLRSKAVERLAHIAEHFPGEIDKNERLRAVCERASWWPEGVPVKPTFDKAPSAAPASTAVSATAAVDTHRDLAAIAEINRLMHRQPTLRELLATTAAEVGKHLGVPRCLISMGTGDNDGQLGADYSAPGVPPADASRVPAVVELFSKTTPGPLGGIELQASAAPALRDLGLESALGIVLTDKETQARSGVLLVGDAVSKKWRPNDSFFLQAIGDQLVLSVNHARLRSLVRSLSVTDERTGLLSRSAYVDCLLAEVNRARSQGTPLSLIILQIDRGSELVRQYGDAAIDKHVEKLARTLSSSVRQTDIAVRYTAWSLVLILPNTALDAARKLSEKLRRLVDTIRPAWATGGLTLSVVLAEASSHPTDDAEDRVTEWINRAEAGLERARQQGGNAVVALATP